MEEERARALLGAERQRLERLLASVDADHDRVAPADEVAEDRLAAGTYGRSVLSGRAIPDERLEAFPLAELTVDEDGARYDPDQPHATRLGPSREPFQVLQDPVVQDNPLVEDDDTTFDETPPERDPAMPDVPASVAADDTSRIHPLP